jgi:hypothetical protein
MRLIAIAATAMVMTAATAGSASALELSCGPAVQNWANGSKTTCPFNSGGQSARKVAAPVVVVIEEPKCHDGKKKHDERDRDMKKHKEESRRKDKDEEKDKDDKRRGDKPDEKQRKKNNDGENKRG